jgi:hypothetical protein
MESPGDAVPGVQGVGNHSRQLEEGVDLTRIAHLFHCHACFTEQSHVRVVVVAQWVEFRGDH